MPRYKPDSIRKCLYCKRRHIDDVFTFGHEKVTNSKQKVRCDICNIYIQCEFYHKHCTLPRHLKRERAQRIHHSSPVIVVKVPAKEKYRKRKATLKRPKCRFNSKGFIVLCLH